MSDQALLPMENDMAKHTGITIRIGSSYDEVRVPRADRSQPEIVFDRSAMRKDGKANLQGELRRTVVEVWAEERDNAKGKRQSRRANKAKYDRRASA